MDLVADWLTLVRLLIEKGLDENIHFSKGRNRPRTIFFSVHEIQYNLSG